MRRRPSNGARLFTSWKTPPDFHDHTTDIATNTVAGLAPEVPDQQNDALIISPIHPYHTTAETHQSFADLLTPAHLCSRVR